MFSIKIIQDFMKKNILLLTDLKHNKIKIQFFVKKKVNFKKITRKNILEYKNTFWYFFHDFRYDEN